MLEITIHDGPEAITFQVGGNLIGAWAKELERSWKKLFRDGAFLRTAVAPAVLRQDAKVRIANLSVAESQDLNLTTWRHWQASKRTTQETRAPEQTVRVSPQAEH